MKILLGVSEEDIKTIRELRVIADVSCMEYDKKADDGTLTDKEDVDYSKWIWRSELFTRMEALIDNQILLDKKSSTPDASEESSSVLSSEEIECIRRIIKELS